jgi:hypothetical protein
MPKLGRFVVLATVSLALAAPPSAFAAGARKHRATKMSTTNAKSSHGARGRRASAKKPIGPRGIDDQRATQIQAALIKAGYLSGEPSGHWDAASQAAMEKLQADNGWQTKLVPDSRALIKLGLGPGSNPASTGQASSGATDSAASNSGPLPVQP